MEAYEKEREIRGCGCCCRSMFSPPGIARGRGSVWSVPRCVHLSLAKACAHDVRGLAIGGIIKGRQEYDPNPLIPREWARQDRIGRADREVGVGQTKSPHMVLCWCWCCSGGGESMLRSVGVVGGLGSGPLRGPLLSSAIGYVSWAVCDLEHLRQREGCFPEKHHDETLAAGRPYFPRRTIPLPAV